jgi:hypothetical protein
MARLARLVGPEGSSSHSATTFVGACGKWVNFLPKNISDAEAEAIQRHERTDRPLGNDDFLSKLELALDSPSDPGDLVRKGCKKVRAIKYGVPRIKA